MGHTEAIEQQLVTLRMMVTRQAAESCAEMEPKHAADLQRSICSALALAETFDVHAGIVDLVSAAAESVPRFPLPRDLVPAPHGFIRLAGHLPMPDMAELTGEEKRRLAELHAGGIAGLLWISVTMVADDLTADGITVVAFSAMPPPLGALPIGHLRWRYGAVWPLETESGAASFVPISWVATFFRFIAQRILTAERRPIRNRAARRRFADSPLHDPVVRVVELRRRETYQREILESEPAEWSCQWLVRGHWHRYHTREGLQPRWVNPYVKGPDDKPLKPPRVTVYEVIR